MTTTSTTNTAREQDYTTWDTHALISRIETLEAELRSLNESIPHTADQAPAHSAPTKKKQQAKKPFDPSKYSTRPIALKFAYLGQKYNGFEHHDNNATPLPTIEEEMWKALVKTKLIFKEDDNHHGARAGCIRLDWEGCEYSKCGRTDKGVSAFGQVIALRVRSAGQRGVKRALGEEERKGVRDELAYPRLLNRVLPPDIRVLAWCPAPKAEFSARFDCRERRYRYFFTQPAFLPPAGGGGARGSGPDSGWLDIGAMRTAAGYYLGEHDFRNVCKLDPSKQIQNFKRMIRRAEIVEVQPADELGLGILGSEAKVYYFEVHGSAFLWHQVRHMVALLFLVGQGYEQPEIVRELLDVERQPTKPFYDMAEDGPLVLWDCVFPAEDTAAETGKPLEDALPWVYPDQQVSSQNPVTGAGDGRHGSGGVNEVLWAGWRRRKMDEILSRSLLDLVAGQPSAQTTVQPPVDAPSSSAKLFDGGDRPRQIGAYTPLLQRRRMESVEVQNARYAARKGLEAGKAMDVDRE